LIASLVSCFVVSFDEVVLSLFLVGSTTQTLPVRMFSFLRTEVTPVLGAISTLLIAAFVIGSIMVFALRAGLNLRNRSTKGSRV
jgi:putative spermidine/putrescine transport system permease protein